MNMPGHVSFLSADRSPPAYVTIAIGPWANIYTIEMTLNECLAQVQSLLSCRSNVNIARSFQGSEAQAFVDFLDRILAQSNLGDKLQHRSLRLLSKISKTRGVIPASYILRQEPTHLGRFHYRGGFADVSDGEHEGLPVAIKRLTMSKGDTDKTFKIIAWKHLSHRNILPLLGISVSMDRQSFSILTEWMPNGNVNEYTRANPKANRLKLLSDIMSGATYLHGIKIVHGDFKGANILVDSIGVARVADFGLMTMTDLSTLVLSETVVFSGGTLSWMSPELLDPPRFSSDGCPTRESDCYALGLVVYEVLTGLRPFNHIIAYTPVPAILRGERPKKPLDATSLGFSDELWELIQLCWSESSSARPSAQQLLDYFSSASSIWTPPPVYPAIVINDSGINDSNSSSLLSISTVVSRGVGTVASIEALLVFSVVSFLFLLI